MEDKQNKTPDTAQGSVFFRWLRSVSPFLVGLAVALVFGWWLFPELLYSTQEQPIMFSHKTHVQHAGMDCEQCHYVRKDGSYSAFPSTEECAACHAVLLGNSREERLFHEEYVKTGKKVPWLVYQKQPDNVYFSHAPHSLQNCNNCHKFSKTQLCGFCHISLKEGSPAYQQDRISGYSKDTMKMWRCERCHANPSHLAGTAANNACFVCHK